MILWAVVVGMGCGHDTMVLRFAIGEGIFGCTDFGVIVIAVLLHFIAG